MGGLLFEAILLGGPRFFPLGWEYSGGPPVNTLGGNISLRRFLGGGNAFFRAIRATEKFTGQPGFSILNPPLVHQHQVFSSPQSLSPGGARASPTTAGGLNQDKDPSAAPKM